MGKLVFGMMQSLAGGLTAFGLIDYVGLTASSPTDSAPTPY